MSATERGSGVEFMVSMCHEYGFETVCVERIVRQTEAEWGGEKVPSSLVVELRYHIPHEHSPCDHYEKIAELDFDKGKAGLAEAAGAWIFKNAGPAELRQINPQIAARLKMLLDTGKINDFRYTGDKYNSAQVTNELVKEISGGNLPEVCVIEK